MADGDIKPWYDGLAPELLGHAQNRGLDKKTADEAARQLLSDHREAQQRLGLPPERVLRLPTDANDPGWADVYQRAFGTPKDAAEYKFEGLKFKDGKEVPAEFVETVRGLAQDLKLPVTGATKLAERIVAYVDKDAELDAQEHATAVAAAHATLRQSWGANYDLNLFKTGRVVEALGWDKATMDGIQGAVGADKLLNGLLSLANKMSEAELLRGNAPPGVGSMTREQAIERLATLRADKSWGAKVVAGDADANREFQDLHKIIQGPPPAAR